MLFFGKCITFDIHVSNVCELNERAQILNSIIKEAAEAIMPVAEGGEKEVDYRNYTQASERKSKPKGETPVFH